MKVSMLKSQMRLMLVWVIGCAILLLLAWLQIIFGHYGENSRDVIEWLLPSIIPTVSLVTGVWAKDAIKKSRSTKKVARATYRVVLLVSIFYLAFIVLIFAIQPFVPSDPLKVLKDSGLILAPLQGVVCVFIGIFFTEESESKS
ncbi:MAG TPA: hypothetical protein VFF14_03420 [Candidatus Deferrimicrobium sp.]|nr:hypothetical protein [Candidatus Deferrimicrobium sp.]